MDATVADGEFPAVPVDQFLLGTLPELPPDAVLSDLAAARHHALWVPPVPVRLVVSVPGVDGPARGRPHSRLPHIQFRRRDLRPDDVVVVDDTPVTTMSRTWIDLAETLKVGDLVAVGDSVLRAGVPVAELEDQIARARGRRGVLRAREAVAHLDARSRSRPESWLRYLFVSGGLPAPDVNVPVVVNGVWIGEPDLSYREARLGVEYQGDGHAAKVRMRKDITRKLDFGEVDWLLLEAGPAEVFRFPERIVHRVRFELTRRAPQLLVSHARVAH